MSKHHRSKQNIKAIILTGHRDFGRCPVATRLSTALWPVAGKTVLERLLTSLAEDGVEQVVICSNEDDSLSAESINIDSRLKIKFLDEQLPVGSAGAVRDAVGDEKDALLLVLPAGMICPPGIDALIEAHYDGQSDLTAVFNPTDGNGKMAGEMAGIYICETSILKHIPKEGYFDIKEGLIPKMLRVGQTVHTAILPHHAGNFRDGQGYLSAVTNYLENSTKLNTNLKLHKQNSSQILWKAVDADIDSSVRIYGQVIIMDAARISEGAVIFGPTILGSNVNIGKDSVIINSVLWDGAEVGSNCEIRRCLIDYNAVVRADTVAEEKSILFKPEGMLRKSVSNVLNATKNKANKLQHILQSQTVKVSEKLPDWAQASRTGIIHWLAGGFLFVAFLWLYWPNLIDLWNIWQRSDEYSAGLLVPFLAVYVLWSRRHSIIRCPIKPCVWGLFIFLAAQGFRLFGLFFMYSSAERLSIVLSIAGLVLLLLGWQFLRKVLTILLFLCLMLPLPNRIQAATALLLQNWATSSAVFCLETVGYEIVQEGNVIHIGGTTVAVAEACNGLRMITAFFVISGLVVLLVKRAWWEKLIVLASSLPVALLCNTVRLAITAVAMTMLTAEYWEKVFHDFGGYAMMPLALAIIVAELWLMTKLTVLPVKEQKIVIRNQKPIY